MKVCIAIDSWKFETFHGILTMEGFEYSDGPGLTKDTMMLYVETNDPERLRQVVVKCQQKAAELKN